MPHQLFIKNFLSFQTPYNSLLLYAQLGTGKTCSAIGVAEEYRLYSKQIGINQRIIIVANPNVQENFKLQLFDERKLKQDENGDWNISSCLGNALLNEINPTNLKGYTREIIVKQINSIINKYYVFFGYGKLNNYITNITNIQDTFNLKEIEQIEIKKIKKIFNNRLIIIDEVHNIRLSDENANVVKKTTNLLKKVAKHADNLRFLMLSATPMFNSYKEIIWITNLMNVNDKRKEIETSDIFNKNGDFIPQETFKDGKIKEGGKELLQRKLTGYISYVRGENPYTFPYRVYPSLFTPENTLKQMSYPSKQMNNKEIPLDQQIKFIDIYLNKIYDYQKKGYNFIINYLKTINQKIYDNLDVDENIELAQKQGFEDMASFNYMYLQKPIEALNIVFPNEDLDKIIEKQETEISQEINVNYKSVVSSIIGKEGLSNIVKYDEKNGLRYNYKYKEQKYGKIFSENEIYKYSSKISNICKIIKNSSGIVLIYSEYIDGGVIPIALTLEEMGFTRYTNKEIKPLFNEKELNSQNAIDSLTMKRKNEKDTNGEIIEIPSFKQAKYIIISGDKGISPSNDLDINYATNPNNKYGEEIKVIIISKAGSEGLDFKNIRQIHIMESWYNMNRIEQIIGRGVRNLSHCGLPFEERNVEIYLHSSLNDDIETADMYIYRLAEKKAVQIGKVSRLLKEISVDCLLNIGQTKLTVENIKQTIKIKIASNKEIDYEVGDKPNTNNCDYLDNCNYTCSPNEDITEDKIIKDTYNIYYIKNNNSQIIKRIKELFKEKSIYKREQLIQSINIVKQYPMEQIFYALTYLIENKNSSPLIDKYGRLGFLTNKENLYLFQPNEISDESVSIYDRSVPIEFKNQNVIYKLPTKEEQLLAIKKYNIDEIKKPIQVVSQIENKDEITEKINEETIKMNNNDEENIIQTQPQPLPQPQNQSEINYDFLLNKIKEHLLFLTQKQKRGNKETNWFINVSFVYDFLQEVYKITPLQIKKYIIYHYLDTLPLNDKITIITKIYITDEKILDDVEIYFKMYFDELKINSKIYFKNQPNEHIKTGVYLNNNENKNILYIRKDDNSWSLAEKADYEYFVDGLKEKFTVNKNKLNSHIGFFGLKKNQGNFEFKTKDITQVKSNTGSVCSQSGKIKILEILNKIDENYTYTADNTKEIFTFSLCCIIELISRYYTETTDKIYFINREKVEYNNLTTYRLVGGDV